LIHFYKRFQMEQPTTPTTTERPKRKCSTPALGQSPPSLNPTKRNIDSGNIKQSESTLPSLEKKTKVMKKNSTPLRVSIPDEGDCKLSDDLADSVKTLCQICQLPVTLTGMRSHTLLKHEIQITKYKELYGPFQIIEHIFHKCHLCGKILLLDSDAMGGHIKGIHKMKERDYKTRFMTYQAASRSDSGGIIEDNKTSAPNVEYDFKTTFPDFEYACNLKHCELCGREGVKVPLEQLEEKSNNEFNDFGKLCAKTDTEEFDDIVNVKSSCVSGQGGWTKKFLPTDVLLGNHLKDETDGGDNDEYDNFDYSDESLIVDSDSSDSSDEDNCDDFKRDTEGD